MTLLMLKIESEQEEYRKLMRLAEELCIEDFNVAYEMISESGENKRDVEMKEAALERVFQRESNLFGGFDEEEEVLQLKALCHVKLYLKF